MHSNPLDIYNGIDEGHILLELLTNTSYNLELEVTRNGTGSENVVYKEKTHF